MATVVKIKNILKSYGIETVEKWGNSGVPYCHAMSIKIPGTLFSVNGKGLTKEFTLASGYGELMERLQLGFVNGSSGKQDGDNSMEADLWKLVSAKELLESNRKWYEKLSERAEKIAGVKIRPDQIVTQFADKNGLVPVMTYYDLTNDATAYFPVKLCKLVYTTNGSAAGNSPEETIVQAISEIVERHHQMRVITENLTLPDVPEADLERCAAAYKIIRYVRSRGYRVIIKDCSLGTSFPVVCACFINAQTGKYHTHFGAYPVFEIALERSLTETFQGRTIDEIGHYSEFLPDTVGGYDFATIFNEMAQGAWAKTAKFFGDTPDFPYNPKVGLKGENNSELLHECVAFFKEQGLDILVRDSSCLGFYTYQVLIPGYSEFFPHRMSIATDETRYSAFAAKTLRDPSKADMQDILGLLMNMEEQKKYPANFVNIRSFPSVAKLPFRPEGNEGEFLMASSLAYVNYKLGRYHETMKCLDSMLERIKDTAYLLCLKSYLSLRLSGKKEAEIKPSLSMVHDQQTVDNLFDILSQGKNPFEQFVLHCDMQCADDCRIKNVCYQKRSLELSKLLTQTTMELDFEKFSKELKELL